MIPPSRHPIRPRIAVLASTLFLLAGSPAAQERAAAAKTAAETELADAEIAPYRADLLDTAFRAASTIPLMPHVKNRSRVQEEVAATCFELDLPLRALRYVEGIANWRRGAGYAELAYHCAKNGRSELAEKYLDLAYEIVESVEGDEAQDWHRDRIRATIARTYLVLGRSEEAALFGGNLVDSEAVDLEVEKAGSLEADAFDETVQALDSSTAIGNFDHSRAALATYTALYGRFYDDAERRELIEERIDVAGTKLPPAIRLTTLLDLGAIAVRHGDGAKALALAADGRRLLEQSGLTPEDEVPLRARFAALRHGGGETAEAQEEADAAFALFEKQREAIVNIYRADSLRPLAEAYLAIGDRSGAAKAYRCALEEGFENPNLWPRAEDLTATCCSMALHDFEPDEPIQELVRKIQAALDTPG